METRPPPHPISTDPRPPAGRHTLRAAAARPGQKPFWQYRRAWSIGLPLGVCVALLAIAPPIPQSRSAGGAWLSRDDDPAFRYRPDSSSFALDFDPRRVQIDLFAGWDREQEAYTDRQALAFVSGPMYERYGDAAGREISVPLGDLKFGARIWRGRNRSAARQRAYVGIRHDGAVEFGYGELTPERERRFDTFLGGLHSIYNQLQQPPAAYRGAYSNSMGQQIRYYLPRIRMVIGLRPDGRLEVLMSRDGLTLEQTRALASSRGLLAAYMPDHASKSRLIVPGVKGFSQADSNWISGGATSFAHVPFLLRLSRRPAALQGSLLASLVPSRGPQSCVNPLQCGQSLGGQLLDRLLAGLNRLIEQGVEPVARLIWAPRGEGEHAADTGAPLREPPISADPLALQVRQRQEDRSERAAVVVPAALKLPAAPAVPEPVLLPQAPQQPAPASPAALPSAEATVAQPEPAQPGQAAQQPEPTQPGQPGQPGQEPRAPVPQAAPQPAEPPIRSAAPAPLAPQD